MTDAAPADGNLPEALDALHKAIDALVEPRIEYYDGRIVTCPGRYDQLLASIDGMQGTGNGRAARSMPPIWVDGFAIVTDIGDALTAWQRGLPELPRPRQLGSNALRIRELAKRSWRPQDAATIGKITTALEGWATDIDKTLNPPRRTELTAPCPACGATTIKRRDTAGELVNVTALQIVAGEGCTCLECHHTWAPGLFQHLANVLECPLPAGVLE